MNMIKALFSAGTGVFKHLKYWNIMKELLHEITEENYVAMLLAIPVSLLVNTNI